MFKNNCLFTILLFGSFLFTTHPAKANDFPQGPIVELNKAYHGTISEVDEKDWYSFNVEPNYQYDIIVWLGVGISEDYLLNIDMSAYFNGIDGRKIDTVYVGDITMLITQKFVDTEVVYSRLTLQTIPKDAEKTKNNQAFAPSKVTFSIAAGEFSPETGGYTFVVFENEIPKDSANAYFVTGVPYDTEVAPDEEDNVSDKDSSQNDAKSGGGGGGGGCFITILEDSLR